MTGAPLSVFVDTNILFSRCLRDWLTLCAYTCDEPLYAVRWSEDVIAELRYSWRRKNPDASEAALAGLTNRFLASHALGKVVGYNPSQYPQPAKDKNDWHVLAAAAHANVHVLLTNDRDTFTPDCVQGRFDVMTSDEFFLLVLHRRPDIVESVTRLQIAYYQRQRKEPPEALLDRLHRAGTGGFAEQLQTKFPDLFSPDPQTDGNQLRSGVDAVS